MIDVATGVDWTAAVAIVLGIQQASPSIGAHVLYC